LAERRLAAGLGVAAVNLGRAAKVATTEGLPFRAAVPAELGDLRRVLGIVGNDGLDAAVSALLGEAASPHLAK
jgi:hypothetical protein